jgi:fatty-acyl-CoA synthase
VRPTLESVEHFISISDAPLEDYLDYEELLAGGASDFDAPDVGEQELLGLFYTSGTTGEPKGGTGKILKKQLRERYWQGRARRIS